MRILKLTDGKAGHITVSDGVIEAIKKHTTVDVIEVQVRIRVKFFLWILRYILKYDLLSSWFVSNNLFMNVFFKNFKKPDHDIDLVVSTGGNTQFVNIWLSKQLKVKNIFCGVLKGVDPEYFALIISTTQLNVPNSFNVELLPTGARHNGSQEAITNFCDETKIDKHGRYFVLLIGGDGSGYKYTKEDYTKLVESFMAIVDRYQAKALITTSRRTGTKEEIFLKELLGKYQANIAYSVYFGQKPEKIVSLYLELGEVIFVTEESGSMISESLYYRKPVFTLFPHSINAPQQYRLFLDSLRAKKRIHRLSIRDELANVEYNQFTFHYLEKLPIDDLSEKIQYFLKEIQ